MTNAYPRMSEGDEDPAAAGLREVDGLAAVRPNAVPPGMDDLLKEHPTALDSGYYVDTGEPLGSEIASGVSFPPELSDRMDTLHRALAGRFEYTPEGDPTEELIAAYYQRRAEA
jgi:hypothetical protein